MEKACSQQGWASRSLNTNWRNPLLAAFAGLATSSHTVQTLLAGKLAKAPENYKMMNFAWTREIARVNYEPLFRHIGEEDITILNTQTYYQACQIQVSGYNTARRPRIFSRNWHWWNFMSKQNIPLARGLWTSITQSSSKSVERSSPHGHSCPVPMTRIVRTWFSATEKPKNVDSLGKSSNFALLTRGTWEMIPHIAKFNSPSWAFLCLLPSLRISQYAKKIS